uniref:Aminoacyl tRNA synthase complex-interacting multifunctional protein 2 n=1 Tax=Ditylenchus dipsaci TaxID=166011 RepID=A0A915DZ52_9BILA
MQKRVERGKKKEEEGREIKDNMMMILIETSFSAGRPALVQKGTKTIPMDKGMYRMVPYTADFVVEPANIIYKMPSYHKEEDENRVPVQESNINKIPIQQLAISTENEKQAEEQIYKQQQALIVELTALDKRLGAFIAKAKVGSKTAGVDQGGKSAQTDQKPKKVEEVKSTSKAESNITQQKESGVDEQSKAASKKADKKAEKKEKKKQHSSAAGPAPDSEVKPNEGSSEKKKEKLPTSSSAIELQMLVKPPVAESPLLVHANLSAATAIFPVHDYFSHRIRCMEAVQGAVEPIELHCSESDLKGWLPGTSLQKDVKSILVKVVLSAGSAGQIKMVYVPQNSREVQTLEGVLPIWKFLGALIGVYCTADVQVSTRIDQWLLWVSESPVNVDQLSRKMSAHLSRYDFLSGSNAVCLADLIVRSHFPAQWTDVEASSNVQLWVKRVDASLNLN